ncbi:MAG: M48 family metallopeptidase [Desulfobacterales bacterium]|jgi:predicted Zn-dependent protease
MTILSGLMRKPFRILSPLFFIAGMLAIISCATVPITGREALHLVPESELLTLSLQQYQEVLKQSKLSTDPEKTAMVRKVGGNIARAAEAFLRDNGHADAIGNYHWEFNLIEDDKTVNAWVMPGGRAAVYTGILPYTRDETGLAVVLGHEVAHALADHGNERMSQALLQQMGGMALAVALSSKPKETQTLAMAAFGVGAAMGFILPYSRLHESEADRIGLVLMARAGYDPREAVPFWERMNAAPGARPPELLSTHPAPETRIADIKAHLPEAMAYYNKTTR